MARIPARELTEGDTVDQVFLVRDCQLSTTKKGQPFARLRLGDETGVVAAIYWDVPEDAVELLRQSRYALVKGAVRTYQDAPQVNVSAVAEAQISDEEAREFLPQSDKDTQVLFERLRKIMGEISNAYLSQFAEAVFADEALVEAFKAAPAASTMHHAVIGGLLEHTTSMAEVALTLTEHYRFLNRDLLLAGVLIHDIGKVKEFTCDAGMDYSDEGRLVGHIGIGLSLVEEKARSVEGFPEGLLNVLKHYVLSHHGEPQFGAIRAPMTAEAIALHYIDNLDAKLNAFQKAVGEPTAQGPNWTPYQRMFESYLYKGDVLGGSEAASEPPEKADIRESDEGVSLF